ncbi:DUF2799 domain-containing protein [Inhella proteolytica]|uniref:DUF2799 domain-containing protein n=1 Tax=Inhella proteolytica TaxID=2795029 RepID=A0A931J912_9BURK|nr:DUF2799 domain-containing protein [Inhella proteolytica]MBH9579012.1 DUF2799 domain-containing protein [Inhella proteolytica]
MKATTALLSLLCLAGCAVMDADDCAQANWRQLGERDALDGHTADRFGKRAKACRKHQIGADQAAYESGHAVGQRAYCSAPRGETDAAAGRSPAALCLAPLQPAYDQGFTRGLQTFCRPRNAYEHARGGGSDPRTCPEISRLGFEAGWRLGREVHELEQRRQRLLNDAAAQRRRAGDDKLKPEERQQASRRASELEAEASRARSRQREAELDALSLPR